jgi:glycerol-3-phosphate dehydrogenase
LTLVDVMTRRLHAHLRSRHVDENLARSVAEVMAPRLGWSPTRVDDEVRTYLAALARSRLTAPVD